jgi:hypothetical protein
MATEPVAPVPSPAPAAPAPSPAPAARAPVPSGGISDQQYDQLAPGPEGQGRYARVRDDANNPQWVRRSDLPPDSPDSNRGAPKPAAGDTPPAPAVGEKVKVGQYETSESEIADLLKFKADRLAQQTGVPSDPGGYQAVLPEGPDFVLPGNVKVEFRADDPAIASARLFAHQHGIDQAGFSQMLYLHAQVIAKQEADFAAGLAREKQALGVNGPLRVDSISAWLRATIGNDDLSKAMLAGLWSAKQVQALEIIAAKMTTPHANFSQAHRTPEPPAGGSRVSDEEYGRMSEAERWEYARSHDQNQFKNGGNR